MFLKDIEEKPFFLGGGGGSFHPVKKGLNQMSKKLWFTFMKLPVLQRNVLSVTRDKSRTT